MYRKTTKEFFVNMVIMQTPATYVQRLNLPWIVCLIQTLLVKL